MLALLIGVTLGLLGGGGSILTLPMLVYVAGVDAKEAIPSSLFVVGATSAVGVLARLGEKSVQWRVGLTFGLSGTLGAFAGGTLAQWVPSSILLVGFSLMMLVTASRMLRRAQPVARVSRPVSWATAAVLGVCVGLVSGLVGAGGGFLVVPALVLVAGLAMREAVATSLLVITMQSFAGFAGHAAHAHLSWPLIAALTLATTLGSLVGSRLARAARPETLRTTFGWLVLAMGLFLLSRQLPTGLAQHVAQAISLIAVAAVIVATTVRPAAREA